MTTGSIWKNLFFLSCPLVFSQVLEVLFNMSDVAVVGRFRITGRWGRLVRQRFWSRCLPAS